MTPQTIEIKLQIVKNIIPFSSCDYDWKITFWNYVTSIDAKNRNTIIFKLLQIIKVDTRALTSQPRLYIGHAMKRYDVIKRENNF